MNKKSFPLSADEIQAVEKRIRPYIHKTPVLSSESINELASCQLFFKCENFQKIGAFKMRGACNALLSLSSEERQKGVVAHSSGNHAQAVALAAHLNCCKAYLVMPENAPEVKVKAVKQYQGEIHFCAPSLKAREEEVEKIIQEYGARLIHPYNDLSVIAGQATVAKELIDEIGSPDLIICPVGGGGLLAGTILSTHYFSPETKVFAGEPELVNDAYLSLKNRKLHPSTGIRSVADGLLTGLGTINFDIILDGVEAILTVSEEEIIAAMQLIWERMKIVIEPSSAVPLAAVLKNKTLFKGKKVGLIISGGNVDAQTLFKSYLSL
jgi:threonine dehydratase